MSSKEGHSGQKFWPLKKFNLHHYPQKQLYGFSASPSKVAEEMRAIVNGHAILENQKRTKNKKLSLLLSSKGCKDEDQTCLAPTVYDLTKQRSTTQTTNNNNNTIIQKTGKEIKAKVTKNTMTAKSAGSGILTTGRASEKTLAKPKLTEDRAKTNPASSHKPNERTQPIVMSESVQKQLQDALDSHSEMQKSSPKEDHAIEHHDNMDISVDRPIQRIQRLRPAASFATMRQLANTNHQKIQHMKKRPVSFMDASSQYDENDVSVHLPSQRAGVEDQQVPFLSASPSPPSSVASGNSYRILSPYVHNLIIKDGDGHRIIQCVGIDDHPSSIEHDRPPPAEMTDEYAFMYSRPPLEEPKLCWIYQQQDALDSHHIRSSSQCRRKDSVKSFSSLSSYDTKLEQLKNKLEKEKATIKALQKQKEAYNKDVIFLSQNVDELTVDNMEWKRQFEAEKIQKERLQEELSKTMTQLDKATEHIRRLESQNQTLIFELKNKELEEKASSPALEGAEKALATQLQHTQNQVRLLKTAMEQFLRMGIFSDALTVSSPTNSTEAFVSDIQKPRRSSSTKKNPSKQTNEKRQKGSKTPQNKLPLSPQPSENKSISTEELDIQLRELVREKEILQAEYSKAPSSGGNALLRRRREELETKLDNIDSQMCRVKLKMRHRHII